MEKFDSIKKLKNKNTVIFDKEFYINSVETLAKNFLKFKNNISSFRQRNKLQYQF